MVKNKNVLAEEGIRFFGKMSASATHEIKNTLSIINENAGLLGDLSSGLQNRHFLTPERANTISQKVAKNVQRADLVLQKLNRFSHSVDLTTQILDIEKTICFVLDLSARLIEQKGVIVEIVPPESPMMVDINLFYLQNMIWRAIEVACCNTEGGKKIMISFGKDVKTPLIWFSMSINKKNSMDDLLESKEDQALMAYLGISIEKDIENNSFGLLWPKQI